MLSKFINKEFFKDRLVSVLAGTSLILGVLGTVLVLLRVEPRDFKIAVRYTENGPDPFKLGDWYTLYDLAFFIGLTTLVAVALSLKLHQLNRPLSLSILIFHHIVVVYFFLVASAILGTSPVTS